MLRTILAIIIGYVISVVLVVAFIFGMWAVLGVEGAFEEGSYMASTAWSIGELATGFVAALIAGLVTAKVGKTVGAVRGLAVFILVLGLAMGAAKIASYPDQVPPRPAGDIDFMAAGTNAQSQKWSLLGVPIVGAIGVLIGGSLGLGKRVTPGGL